MADGRRVATRHHIDLTIMSYFERMLAGDASILTTYEELPRETVVTFISRTGVRGIDLHVDRL